MIYEYRFLLSLITTIVIEAIVLVLSLYKKRPLRKILFVNGITSSLTLPYLWFIYPLFISNHFWYVLSGEIIVVIIEAIILKELLGLYALESLKISFIANLVSYVIGTLFFLLVM